ncbi:MAG: hypothetical protein R3231_05430 [bacterium]|nr:hypothetical protein [bacterium]
MKPTEIQENTKLLQGSDQPLWVRVRELIREKGIDPLRATVAYAYPEDLHFELGVIVTPEGRVFQYGFDYLHQAISDGVFSEWEELTDRYESSPYRNQVTQALRMAVTDDRGGDSL